MTNKNITSKKSQSRKSKRPPLKAQDRAYLTCSNDHVNKYELKSRDKEETLKCPECGVIVVYDPQNEEINAE